MESPVPAPIIHHPLPTSIVGGCIRRDFPLLDSQRMPVLGTLVTARARLPLVSRMAARSGGVGAATRVAAAICLAGGCLPGVARDALRCGTASAQADTVSAKNTWNKKTHSNGDSAVCLVLSALRTYSKYSINTANLS